MRQLFALLATVAFSNVAGAATKTFGEPITVKEETKMQTVLEQFDAFKDRDVLTSGTVTKVCEKKGCWMTIQTDAQEVRVTFKDYKFFMPLNAGGSKARLQGRIERKEVSVSDQRHYLEDAGADAAAIKAITAPKTEYSFVASGVELGS